MYGKTLKNKPLHNSGLLFYFWAWFKEELAYTSAQSIVDRVPYVVYVPVTC